MTYTLSISKHWHGRNCRCLECCPGTVGVSLLSYYTAWQRKGWRTTQHQVSGTVGNDLGWLYATTVVASIMHHLLIGGCPKIGGTSSVPIFPPPHPHENSPECFLQLAILKIPNKCRGRFRGSSCVVDGKMWGRTGLGLPISSSTMVLLC